MRVQQAVLDEVLGFYALPFRYLTSADVRYPDARGTFSLGHSVYAAGIMHATEAEAVICINQLAYLLFHDAAMRGEIRGLSLDAYLARRQEWGRILVSEKAFHREIPRDFSGRITAGRVRSLKGHTFADVGFTLHDGAATGSLLVGL